MQFNIYCGTKNNQTQNILKFKKHFMKTSILVQIIFFLSLQFSVVAQIAPQSLTTNSSKNCPTKINGSIIGQSQLCEFVNTAPFKYEVTPSNNIVSYVWTVPQGMGIYAGQNSNQVFADIDYTFTNGYVTVKGINVCGQYTQTDSFYVDLLPSTPIFQTSTDVIRPDQIYTYSVNQSNDVTYNWVAPYGSVIMNGQGTETVSIKFSQSFNGGLVEVYSENGCGVSQLNQINVTIDNGSNSQRILSQTDRNYNNSKTTLVGDIAFHSNLTNAQFNDTIKNNDTYYFEVVVQNYSQSPMDSVYLKYFLNNNPNNYQLVAIKRLEAGEGYTLPVLMIPTDGLSGDQELMLELNPNKEKPESDYTNNNLKVPFHIENTLTTSVSKLIPDNEVTMFNFPNPVVDHTKFYVKLGSNFIKTESVLINIFDLSGQFIKRIRINNQNDQGEFISESWNGLSEYGNTIESGVYFYTINVITNQGKVKTFVSTKHIHIVK